MNRPQTALIAAATLVAASASAQIQIPPAGLQPGDQYRIVFVTDSMRDGTSSDIADYNAHVLADVAATPQLAALNTSWSAIAGTASITARQNTMTDPTPAGATGVPIYLPNGVKVADDYDDLWDGSLDHPIDYTATGGTLPAGRAWTGCIWSGLLQGTSSSSYHPLGTATPWGGDPVSTTLPWMGANKIGQTANLPLYGMSDVMTVPPAATVEDLGSACTFDSRAFRFVPNANGGHDVSYEGTNAFDPNIGVFAGATADDLITATGLDLGFAFPFPTPTGTAPEQFVRIDPNGRILPDSSNEPLGNNYPSPFDLFGNPFFGYPMVCPFWCDFNPADPNSDGIYWKTQPGSATFTWNQVAQFSGFPGGEAQPMTVQCTLFANGEVLVVIEDVAALNVGNFFGGPCLIGISSGNVAGSPPAIDLTQVVNGATASGTPAYEWFQEGTFDLTPTVPTLVASNTPRLGVTFSYSIQDSPTSATTGLYLLGTNLLPSAVPLSNIGLAGPCSLMVQFVDIQVGVTVGPGQISPAAINIPATPAALIGFELYLQGATDGGPFASPLLMTNALRATVGV